MSAPLFAWLDGELDPRRVTQCALSRVCGGCGRSLGRPIAFVGSEEEVARNEFHAPPMHQECAHDLSRRGTAGTAVVLTGGFEFVRPTAEAVDRRCTFVPNSLVASFLP
ncbi:hypothetical protein ABIE44_002544 [Marmoricola sp. OAE513]|uniref:hypothetical protein n=1 Tax=Marmoricola sp. OAE513 TaxID=2817894 RepID=UPI001AEADF15